MLFALAAIVVVFVAGNVIRQRAARREQDANDRAAMERRARVRELRAADAGEDRRGRGPDGGSHP